MEACILLEGFRTFYCFIHFTLSSNVIELEKITRNGISDDVFLKHTKKHFQENNEQNEQFIRFLPFFCCLQLNPIEFSIRYFPTLRTINTENFIFIFSIESFSILKLFIHKFHSSKATECQTVLTFEYFIRLINY